MVVTPPALNAIQSKLPDLFSAAGPAFITCEGIDGSGKSTQLRWLAGQLRHELRSPKSVVVTREPGGTALGARLRDVLLEPGANVDPLAELLLYAADRAQHVRTLIRPALRDGRIVLSDRYADATVAYQGGGRGFPQQLIERVIELAAEDLRPDLTLVFDVSPEEGLRRRARRAHRGADVPDRFDAESLEFHTRVRAAYRQIAEREPARVKIIEATGSIQEVRAHVVRAVAEFFANR